MAIPRVFVSSTCYDLKYIRENLKYFVRTIGYDPVLSEDGSIFYDPGLHVHDSVISEVPNCQLFVLIIGGRFGARFVGKETSITNEEYREAVRKKIPVFALVESGVYSDYQVYNKNRNNSKITADSITYPSADSTKIFAFLDEVQQSAVNNALVPFRDFSDIESYLKQQWAGMMFSFLSTRNETNRVADMMSHIVKMNERVEFLSTQLLRSVGSAEANLLVHLYEFMLDSPSIKTLIDTGHKPNPVAVLKSRTLSECAKSLGEPFEVHEDVDFSTTSSGKIEAHHLAHMETDFDKVRKKMLKLVSDSGISLDALSEGHAKS